MVIIELLVYGEKTGDTGVFCGAYANGEGFWTVFWYYDSEISVGND